MGGEVTFHCGCFGSSLINVLEKDTPVKGGFTLVSLNICE